MAMRILVSASEAERYLNILPDALRERAFGQGLERAANRYAESVRAGTAVRSGQTRDSVFVEPIVEEGFMFRVEVFSTSFVARFLEGGTAPHEILPVTALIARRRARRVARASRRGEPAPEFSQTPQGPRALKIGAAFVARVEHPGMAARPVWGPEAARAFDRLEDDMAEAVQGVLEE
jgi:hypothetical protein